MSSITTGRAAADKMKTVFADALELRFCGAHAGRFRRGVGGYEIVDTPRSLERAAQHMSAMDMAKESLRLRGIQTDGMSPIEIAQQSLTGASIGGAMHTSGSFPELLKDASNKTLLAAYNEAPSTWREWTKLGQSAQDFKEISRVGVCLVKELGNIGSWRERIASAPLLAQITH